MEDIWLQKLEQTFCNKPKLYNLFLKKVKEYFKPQFTQLEGYLKMSFEQIALDATASKDYKLKIEILTDYFKDGNNGENIRENKYS